MPKQYVKLRIGLLDHLPMLASHPDALVVYIHALLTAPMSGPEAGCVRINQTQLASEWRWGKARLSRAVKWLQNNPAPNHPLLVLVERGTRSNPGRYVIPRFETGENRGRFGSAGATNPPVFVSKSVTQAQRIASFVSKSVPLVQRNSNKNARAKNEEYREQGGVEVYEDEEWVTVKTEAQAREVLLLARGYGQIPESMRERALETAMKNLEFYRIRYEPDEDDEAVAR